MDLLGRRLFFIAQHVCFTLKTTIYAFVSYLHEFENLVLSLRMFRVLSQSLHEITGPLYLV